VPCTTPLSTSQSEGAIMHCNSMCSASTHEVSPAGAADLPDNASAVGTQYCTQATGSCRLRMCLYGLTTRTLE
jgi:hypothetical protein